MFVPFFTPSDPRRRLFRRKGGGGGGGGRGGSGRSGGKGSNSGSKGNASSGSKDSISSVPTFSTGGKKRKSRLYGGGGGVPTTIPDGQMFAGRTTGGGTRSQIYGTKMYGSGYPGIADRGVAGRGFPFYFWPIVWGTGVTSYLYSNEYGQSNNTSRPGGPIAAAAFQSASTGSIFRIVADTGTVSDLIYELRANCSDSLYHEDTSTTPSPYGGYPRPEQVIQYYRASSIALTLDKYNNSAVDALEGASDTPIPDGVDTTLMGCLNQTIGLAAPLVDGAPGIRLAIPNLGFLGLVYVLWTVLWLI